MIARARIALAESRERAVIWLAYRLPRRLVYWCAIRVMSSATVGLHADQVVPDLRAADALERWA